MRKLLRQTWFKKFGQAWQSDNRQVKMVSLPGKNWFFRVVYSPALEQWNKSPLRKKYNEPGCFFCAGYDEYHDLEKVGEYGNIDIYHCVKFVAPCHYLASPKEHRSEPEAQDIISLAGLSNNTGLVIFGNFENSGASYARHIHYQPISDELPANDKITADFLKYFLKPGQKETVLPITLMPGREIFSGRSLSLKSADWIASTYFWEYGSEKGKVLAAAAAASIAEPHNLIFSGNRIYLIGRKKSYFESAIGKIKIASAEVCGCFYCRQKDHFDFFNAETITQALSETCLLAKDPQTQNFEKQLILKTKEVCQ